MKCSLGISNFLEEISSLSHSIISLYLFTLITEEVFLISPGCSLELWIQMGISFLFSLPLASLIFSAICKAPSDNHFALFHFFFLVMVLIPVSCTIPQTSSIVLQGLCLSDLILWIYLSLPLYNCKRFDLGNTWKSSDVPYFLQFKSEFGNTEFMIWATVCSSSCFCWLYRTSPSLAAKNIINLI